MTDVKDPTPRREKTGFDKYFEKHMQDPTFAEAYRKEREEIDAIERGDQEDND